MPEVDAFTRQLRALGDEGLGELRLGLIREQIDRELGHAVASRRAPRRRPAGMRRGALLSAASVVITLAVVVVSITLVSGAGPRRVAATPGANRLIARLAVLRRPQTAADRLPAHLHLLAEAGAIVPRLTRRVFERQGLAIYLVVTTPPRTPRRSYTYPFVNWPRRFGDQASLLAVHNPSTVHPSADQSDPFPAVDLDNARQFSLVSRTAHGDSSGTTVQVAQLVPDGIAHVRWEYASRPDQFTSRPTSTVVTNNIALAPAGHTAPRAATWLTASGTIARTSDAAARRVAATARQQQMRRVIRLLDASHEVAPPALLQGFAIFNTGGPASFTRDGVTVKRPQLTDVPIGILDTLARDVARTKVDPSQLREVTTPSGRKLWVVPGANGLCLAVQDSNLLTGTLPGNLAGGPSSTSGCSAGVAPGLSEGIGFSSAFAASGDFAAGVLPRSHPTTTVRGRDGRRRSIDPPLGVYFVRIPRP